VTGSCEYGDEPSGSGATELVRSSGAATVVAASDLSFLYHCHTTWLTLPKWGTGYHLIEG
jgi:hypothetical protein